MISRSCYQLSVLCCTILAIGQNVKAVDLMYVTETFSHVISVRNTEGNLLYSFGSGYLSAPTGLVFDQSGNLYVANNGTNSITKFDSNGNYTSTISSNLIQPEGLAIDSSGNLYAANSGGDSVSQFDPSGNFIKSITINIHGPNGISFDSQGYLYVASTGDNSISKFDSSGNYLSSINSNLYGPTGLAFSSNGDLYTSQYHGNWVSKFTINDNFVAKFGSSSSLNYAKGMAFDALGNLYVANSSGTISKFDSSENLLWRTPSGICPNYIAFKTVSVPEPSSFELAIIAACTAVYLGRINQRQKASYAIHCKHLIVKSLWGSWLKGQRLGSA